MNNNGVASTFTTNKDIGYNTAPITANMATGGAGVPAWEAGATNFLTTVPTTLTTAAPSFLPLGPITVAGNLLVNQGNSFRDQGQQITGNNTVGNSFVMQGSDLLKVNPYSTSLVLGVAGTTTDFPNQFATINLKCNYTNNSST